ncbi:hypothetical protein ACFE04_030292 [Oxalis oulophora]
MFRRITATKPLNPNHHPTIEALTKPQLKTLVLNNYTNGKFSNLIQNVVALPSLLLTASHNLTVTPTQSKSSLFDSVSKHFSIHQLGIDILSKTFDFHSSCVKFTSTNDNAAKGQFFTLPNLKLKVLIEAIRIVLEIVYDDRFVTFSYGGRVGMGRHTAIRYLKNYVDNPTWWFTVSFSNQKFDKRNVDKLCLFMGERIDDGGFIELVRLLFEYDLVRIDFGGCYLGRGLPQENGLASILINIYFDGFDKKIQDMRLEMKKQNPRLDQKDVDLTSNVYYKPLKLYAVRYLDEILVITTGSKMMTMDLMNDIVKSLENDLELKVDRAKTAIHSATSEKIGFIGMELQAVTPSVLRPPMSEKAIRAKKKYLRQKEVESLELKNLRERNRKVLGMKILSHLFKKSKRSDGFKSEFPIENEVRKIFGTWADEVVREFLTSLEDRWTWHRMLMKGDFLSLRHIREQLPQELVDSFDRFQDQVDKHLSPVKANQALEEEKIRLEEADEQKYAERTVQDLTKLCMKVSAPLELVRKAVKLAGFTNHMGRPQPISFLTALEDVDIIKWYAGIGKRWLDYFCCCHNFKVVKTVVTYHLRFSCILTLAEKHEATKREAIKNYTKDLKVSDMNGNEEVHFPTEREIKMMGDKELSDPKPVDGALSLGLIRLAVYNPSHCCIAHFCNRTDTIVYRLRLMQNQLDENSPDNKWIQGMGAIHDALDRKCLPLCSDHIHDLYMGKITLQDIDCTSFVDDT